MARYPKAIQKPITISKGRKKMAAYNRVNLHVAVSESASIHNIFNRAGAADSHFYIRKDGTVEQYVDTAYRANADLEGNDTTISIETQGGVTKPDSEEWTPQQVQAIAELYAWTVETHGIKTQIAKDSRLGSTSHGLSWHRLGIDGNFPSAGLLGGRIGGGMKYSSSRGKLCPGGGKINQVPEIFAVAKKILNPPKKKLAASGGFDKDVAAELQRQLGKLEVDAVFGKKSVKRYRERINAKNGKGGFKLTNGPLKGGDTLTSRDIKAGEKLINVWHKRTKGKGKDFVLVKGPLKLTGKLTGRTASAFRKSLNDDLWK